MSEHDAPWTSRPGRALVITLAVLAIEVQCAALAFRVSLVWPLVLHVATCSVVALLAIRRGPVPTPATATMQMLAMMLPFLGPVAPAAAIVILLTAAFRHDPAANAALWHDHLFPNLAVDGLTEQAEAISRHRTDPDTAGEIESFYDVLRWGALSEQEHVLSLISRSFKPEFAAVLRAGLAVDDLGLRAQAAAGLSLLEARTSTRLGELQDEFRRAPAGDGVAAMLLAQALSDAAHSGLYDEARAEEMRTEIVTILSPLAAAADPRVIAMLGRTLVQLGQFDRATETLDVAANAGERGEAAFSWLLEAVFRQGDFRRLSTLLAARADDVRRMMRQDGPLSPALRFWAEGA